MVGGVEDPTWPDLIEMQLQMEGRTVPLRMVWATPTDEAAPGAGGQRHGHDEQLHQHLNNNHHHDGNRAMMD